MRSIIYIPQTPPPAVVESVKGKIIINQLEGGGGGGGPAPVPCPTAAPNITSGDITNAIPINDSKPAIDPAKYINCFTDGKPAQSYIMTIYVDQPIAGSNNQWTIGNGSGNIFVAGGNRINVGHTFVGFQKNNTDGTSVTQIMGFYPGSSSMNTPGVIKDDSGHSYDVSYSTTVNVTQFSLALNSVISSSRSNYVLSNVNGGLEMNCTDAALSWMNNAGISVPADNSRGLFTNTPGDYGQSLRYFSGANTNGGFAANGHGPSN